MSDSDSEKDRNKQIKRMCVYRKEWEQKYDCIRKHNFSRYKSYCNLCSKSFHISHGGLNDVKRHCSTSEHKRNAQNVRQNQTLQHCLNKDILTLQEEKIVAAETTLVYHAIKHTVSFRSLDCYASLLSTLFSDSKVAVKSTIGRTKAAAIAHNILGQVL